MLATTAALAEIRIGRLDRGIAWPSKGDVLELRLNQDVLLTGPLHEEDIAMTTALLR